MLAVGSSVSFIVVVLLPTSSLSIPRTHNPFHPFFYYTHVQYFLIPLCFESRQVELRKKYSKPHVAASKRDAQCLMSEVSFGIENPSNADDGRL